MSGRRIFRICTTCRRRPGIFGYAVYRCHTCHSLCCERCIVKGVFHLYCPHCRNATSFKQVGYTR